MLQFKKTKVPDMNDYDAAAALLMLSGRIRTAHELESNNNYSTAAEKVNTQHQEQQQQQQQQCVPSNTPPPAGTPVLGPANFSTTQPLVQPAVPKLTVPAPKVATLSTEDLIRQRIWQKTLRTVPDGKKMNVSAKHGAIPTPPGGRQTCSSPTLDGEGVPVADGGSVGVGRPSIIYGVGRLGSSSPDLHRWDSGGRTSSPIVAGCSSSGLPSPHSVHENDGELRAPPVSYDSPGMNGFALQLSKAAMDRNNYLSSPEPSPIMAAPALADSDRKRRRLYNQARSSCTGGGGPAGSNVEEKSLNSPTDSGVSSIYDELLQPNLRIKVYNGANICEGLPLPVRLELNKMIDISTHNKELYTQAKMATFPTDMGFNPNKSRFRKECTNAIDNLDREKNNEASRRSRHKKKMVTHLMNVSLEYDRNENRQLYIQERWLTDMIFELEEKALSQGVEPLVLLKLRSDCGFQ